MWSYRFSHRLYHSIQRLKGYVEKKMENVSDAKKSCVTDVLVIDPGPLL